MPRTIDALRIVILGMMGRCPFGGQTWLYLSWLDGLRRLGHEVWYVEDDTVWLYDPVKDAVTDDCSYAVRHIGDCMSRLGLPDNGAYRLADRKGACWGVSEMRLSELYSSCAVLLNVVGATEIREEHATARLRVYVEFDPVTAELQMANGDAKTREAFAQHHVLATYGENYGAADCLVPLNGITFHKTRQPVALDLWPMAFDADAKFFTTPANYRQEGNDVQYNGETYCWSKHHEWENFIGLPRWTDQRFELAMMVDGAEDLERLESQGWRIVSPVQMSLDVCGAYQDFFRCSRAEFTVAKDQNVRLRSGWTSERDACYLASGKPVVAQDTGFSNILPTGKGLFAFRTMDEALATIDAINSDYRGHCEAARAIAEEYFAAEKVPARLLRDIGLA
jgi:hypothetical protein